MLPACAPSPQPHSLSPRCSLAAPLMHSPLLLSPQAPTHPNPPPPPFLPLAPPSSFVCGLAQDLGVPDERAVQLVHGMVASTCRDALIAAGARALVCMCLQGCQGLGGGGLSFLAGRVMK